MTVREQNQALREALITVRSDLHLAQLMGHMPQDVHHALAVAKHKVQQALDKAGPACADGWQPIETVPKNQRVLVHSALPDAKLFQIAFYSTFTGRWEAEYQPPVGIPLALNDWAKPTHWMHLPAAPTIETEAIPEPENQPIAGETALSVEEIAILRQMAALWKPVLQR